VFLDRSQVYSIDKVTGVDSESNRDLDDALQRWVSLTPLD
jgi:hypothetical protein